MRRLSCPSEPRRRRRRGQPPVPKLGNLRALITSARLTARRQGQALLDAAPEGVAVYDTAGQLVRSDARYRALLARIILNRPTATLRQWIRRSRVHDAQGRRLQEAHWPHTRILQGR